MSTTQIVDLVPFDDSDRAVDVVYVPTIGFVAKQGGNQVTDARGVTYAPTTVTLASGTLDLGALITQTAATTS